MNEYIQVVTTTQTEEDACRIARMLVKTRLAACVQVLGPVTSTYRWKGEIQTSREWQCMAKSRRDRFGKIEAIIRDAHPYEVPEILAFPVLAGSPAYLDWLAEELEGG